jgi:hypothetical protein
VRTLLSVFILLLPAVSAHAQIHHGNDAITLSVGNEFEAHLIAAEFCASGDKYTIIKVHRGYGDEIAINCLAAPRASRPASAQPGQPATASPAPQPASTQPGQPATNPITGLFAQLQRSVTNLWVAAQPQMPATAPPAPQPASAQPGQPATNPITGLFAQLQRSVTNLSAAAQPQMPAAAPPVPQPASAQPGQPATNPVTGLFAQLQRSVTTLSVAAQPEVPASDREPPARSEHDSTVRRNIYAQAW